jgi:hypothetical protein
MRILSVHADSLYTAQADTANKRRTTMPILLYSFQDQTTGEIRDVRAPSEDAARTSLGGIWTDRTRAASWTACDIGDLHMVLSEAMREERRALDAELKVHPHHCAKRVTPQMLEEFAQAQDLHRKAKARVRQLMRMIGALE